MATSVTSEEVQLVQAVASYYSDPYGFVWFAFPWGQPGTPLAREHDGPDPWQARVLIRLGRELVRAQNPDEAEEAVGAAIRMAIASGHGIGKTALVAWIIIWFISTRPNPQIVVTANTGLQLKTKTWRELAKWHKMAINSHWFVWTATQFKLRAEPETWFATAVPWSAHNPSAFAGTHESHVLMLFDEASEIDAVIWETAEGALTTGSVAGNTTIWLAFGNPTQNTGRFRQCWTKFRKRWVTEQVDSRDSKRTDKRLIREWIEDYGEDSDFVRVRVRGVFPRVGPRQFIGNHLVEAAQKRFVDPAWIHAATPRLMGVDIAREGDDESVIVLRRGAKMLPDIFRYRIPDLMVLASEIAGKINEWKPDLVFVDGTGMGSGVYDRLVQLGYQNVVDCRPGNKEQVFDRETFYNCRIEWWARMKEWLRTADIPDDNQLYEDLIGPEQLYDLGMKLRLERKEDMKKRGLPSPDTGDALSMTFAHPVPVKPGLYRQEDLEPEAA